MTSSLNPPFLKPGDTIAITCPSGYLPEEASRAAVDTFKSWGYQVIIGETVGKGFHYFSDTDENRLRELQEFLDAPQISAIIMGRGGYGLSRIIDAIDFSKFKQYPKWICGFSDITVLHAHINKQLGVSTLHSPMCSAFKVGEVEQAPWVMSLKNALEGYSLYSFETEPHLFNRPGQAVGELCGGNLAILAHLSGSKSQLDTKNKILFIEDVGEYLYNIDRMLLCLKRAGMFEHLAALVCGGFTELQDTTRPFGQNIYQIILDKVKEYDYPVLFDLSVGHLEHNYTLGMGMPYLLHVTPNFAHFKKADIKQKNI